MLSVSTNKVDRIRWGSWGPYGEGVALWGDGGHKRDKFGDWLTTAAPLEFGSTAVEIDEPLFFS